MNAARAGLLRLFGCAEGEALAFPAGGGWQAALAATLSPGERVLAPRFGRAGQQWIEAMQRAGLEVQVLECEWGEGAPEARIAEALRADADHLIRAVMVVHAESSTGVTSDLAAVRCAVDAVRHPALLYADAAGSLGGIEFRMSEWRVDFALAGTQKGLLLQAGPAIACAGPKLLGALPQNRLPHDAIAGLRESLERLFAEGLGNVYARHRRLAAGVREAVAAWGLGICARHPRWYSDSATAVMVPARVNAASVVDAALRRYGLALGAGAGPLAGKAFRIRHLGGLNEVRLLGMLAGVEMSLADAGARIKLGSGVGAAQQYWRRSKKVNGDRPHLSQFVR